MSTAGASAVRLPLQQSDHAIGAAAIGVHFPKILLPKKGVVDFKKWAVVACDQYTSEEDYWHRVQEFVGDSPSTLRLTFPEVYLDKGMDDGIISAINKSMIAYESHAYLEETATPGAVMVERTFRDGVRRRGVVLALDLDLYEFAPNNSAPIRATEQTIVDRIPPRLKVRRGATLELPHILVLFDDPDFSVIEPLMRYCSDGTNVIYDTELMENSGHLKGWWIAEQAALSELSDSLLRLADAAAFNRRYSTSSKPPSSLLSGTAITPWPLQRRCGRRRSLNFLSKVVISRSTPRGLLWSKFKIVMIHLCVLNPSIASFSM
jgi:hypothetical protein